MEESLACRTMLYNIHERKWDDELTELAGAAGRLPPGSRSGRRPAGFNKGYGAALRAA